MKRREFLGTVGAGAAALAAGRVAMGAARREPASAKPNIVVIVADDLGWGHVGYQGSPIRTPHLDRLAAAGVQLDRHYVAPVCSPTRAGLLSGRYWSRFGVVDPVTRRVFPWDTVTLPAALRTVGYETAISGKWHLGAKPEWGPRKFGFDRSYGSLPGGLGPYTHLYRPGEFQRAWHRNDELLDEEGHVTDLFTREAVERIERNAGKPLFLYVPFTAPHFPISEPQEWMERNAHITDPSLRLYGAAISHMDDAIGRIVTALERTGKRENTLLLFFSDNGAPGQANHGNYPGEYEKLTLPGTNLPLRGKKGQVYEGGIRTPAFVVWPGRLRPGKYGGPLHVTDWMPTFCGLAGCRPEKDLKWDGEDVWRVLESGSPGRRPRTLYCKGPGGGIAFMHGDWKPVMKRGSAPELYHLAEDPGEKRDLAPGDPERVATMVAAMREIAADDNDAVAKD